MKQLEVQILGQSYLLGCPEGGEGRLLDAVEKVDTAMCKIRDAGKVKARDRIAVLAALNLAFDVSDRHAAAAALQTPGFVNSDPPLAATATNGESFAASANGMHDPRLASLLGRLDNALGTDGRLL